MSLFKYVPYNMLDFTDEGIAIRGIFGNPEGVFFCLVPWVLFLFVFVFFVLQNSASNVIVGVEFHDILICLRIH